jgi:hypothetical protein
VNAGAVAGLGLMIGSEAATLAGLEPFPTWNTPICWTGFILFADSIVFSTRGNSWLRSNAREFVWLALVSIPLWLVFEFFNLYIRNWYYVGLPENPGARYVGYAWSFATIWPAIFVGAELVSVWRKNRDDGIERRRSEIRGARVSSQPGRGFAASQTSRRRWLRIGAVAGGAALLAWPVIWPSPYLAAPVWLGFIFLLDPINQSLGAESLLGDLERGNDDRLKNLMLSGLLCGILWEFWNYWSRAKWHYTVPIMENLKVFEMPVPGYLGFPAFALECFTMYVFARRLVTAGGRPIALS